MLAMIHGQNFGVGKSLCHSQHLKRTIHPPAHRENLVPGFSKELALQSTLTALILICCTSLSKKLDGTETSSNKHPSKKKTNPYRGEGAKETELIHPCGFLNSSILPAIFAE